MEAISIGDAVTFTDEIGRKHDALVTSVHGFFSKAERDAHYEQQYEDHKTKGASWATEEWLTGAKLTPFKPASVNLVYVSKEENQNDPYGRQIVRKSSVPPHDSQAANGYYWMSK